jgi:hypothetical protein
MTRHYLYMVNVSSFLYIQLSEVAANYSLKKLNLKGDKKRVKKLLKNLHLAYNFCNFALLIKLKLKSQKI